MPDAAVDENGLFTGAEAHCDCPYDFEGEFCEMEKGGWSVRDMS